MRVASFSFASTFIKATSAFSLLPSLKKAELTDIFLEGLLLEVETDEIKQLNFIFKEQYKIGEFEQFKLKLREISQLSASASEVTTTVNLSQSNSAGDDFKLKNSKIDLFKSSNSQSPSTSSSTNSLSEKRVKLRKTTPKSKSSDEGSAKSLNNGLSGKKMSFNFRNLL